MKYVLGADAGGTKTIVRIADEHGRTIADGTAGPVHVHLISDQQFIATLANALANAVHGAGKLENLQFDAAFLGIAGIDSAPDKERAMDLVRKVVRTKDPHKLRVENDTKIVRAAGSSAAHGVAVISGTGSNIYGINRQGQEAWAIGLGHVMSDEGSSHWIGERALRLATRSYDGRGERAMLEQAFMRYFAVKDFRELGSITQRLTKNEIAALSPIVEEVAYKKDKIAMQIFEEAAAQLALGVNTVTEKLAMQNNAFDIVLSGGTFNSQLPFVQAFKRNLKTPKAKIIVLKTPPINGAIQLALQLLT